MLNEYSDSAAVTTKAAAKAAGKVADAVVSSKVATPPPPPATPPPPSEIAESAMDSVMKAASVAQDAADQAAAAAAAVASKGVAATKAAAVAGTSVAGGIQLKPLVGGVFVPATGTKLPFQVDPSKVSADNAFDASARAKANLAILKANFVGGIGAIKEGPGDVSTSASSLHLDISNMPKIGTVSVTPAFAAIIASLHLKEYGGWYVAVAMAIYASQQRSAGKEDASAEFELELVNAREKASEAASAAGLAAEGAKTAKKLAMKMEKDLKIDGGKALLESSRSKMAEMEKGMMENEMCALQAEVVYLRSQLEKTQGEKKKAPEKTKTVTTEIEAEYPTKFVMETDPDEDERIVELLKLLDEENSIKKKKAAEELEKKREEEAKFVAAEKSKAISKKMTKGVEAAQAKAEVAKKKAAAKKSKKKSATKSTRKMATKSVAKKASRTVATVDDWASLAESTLKRKTVAQLSEYLTGKGVTVTDGSGKSLKKAELLAAVKGV